MKLLCCVCAYVEGKGDTEAMTIINGFAVCEDHDHVASIEGRARAIVEGNQEAATSETAK